MITKLSFSGYKGQTRDYDLSRLNLVTGPNGSGKTSIYEGIYIALMGRHPYLGEQLGAIKKQCSKDDVHFGIVANGASIDRNIIFGDKTVHNIIIDGRETKVKEAEREIEAIFPSSIMRLDIGKFAKMGDMERAALLSELLGSSKIIRKEIALDILDRYYMSFPEGEFVLKYKLGKNPNDYDKGEFIATMREVIAADKNPIILEMVDICTEIMDGEGVVDSSEALDEMYAGIKKYRDAKAQEKNYAQKTFAEMTSSERDIDDVQKELEIAKSHLQDRYKLENDLNNIMGALGTDLPAKSEEELKAALKDAHGRIDDIDKKISALQMHNETLDKDKAGLQEKLQAWDSYDAAMHHIDGLRKIIQRDTDKLDDLLGNIHDESKVSIADLEKAKAHYLAMKELSSGECPTCGTIITEEQAKASKAAKKKAKSEYDAAVKELQLRKNNESIRNTVKTLKEQNEGRKKELDEKLASVPKEPKADREEYKKLGQKIAEEKKAIEEELKIHQADARNESNAIGTIERDIMTLQVAKKRLEQVRPLLDKYVKGVPLADVPEHLEVHRNGVHQKIQELLDNIAGLKAEEEIHEKMKGIQEKTVALSTAYGVLAQMCDIIRAYKNEAVERKIAPVQLLAKKYYVNKEDEIVITPKTIGVNRDGQYIEQAALSSGESLSLMSAVLVAIMEASGMSPKYLFVDAAEIDVHNMEYLLGALEKSTLDTVIVAHHMPLDTPNGWNHIKL